MLRILLWKLGFEWANLVRLLWPRDDERIYYFAFGANLSPAILKQRKMTFYETFEYVLEGAELCFSQSGFYKDHGFASADPAPDKQVYGRMYLVRKSDARRMDYYEGVPFLKAHDKVVQQYQDKQFYYYRARQSVANLKPTSEYLGYLTTAYYEMTCVPADYRETMAATETLATLQPQSLTGKFVSDLERWPKILHPVLVWYEATCRRTVHWLWNSSLLVWLIKA